MHDPVPEVRRELAATRLQWAQRQRERLAASIAGDAEGIARAERQTLELMRRIRALSAHLATLTGRPPGQTREGRA